MSIFGDLDVNANTTADIISSESGLSFDTSNRSNRLYFGEDILVDGKRIDGKKICKYLGNIAGTDLREGDISDGYHTFDDLYDHRIYLYLSLIAASVNMPNLEAWWSTKHHIDDKDIFNGHIIVGINNTDLDTENQISYHMKAERWTPVLELMTKNRLIEKLPYGRKWDGHTPESTLECLNRWFLGGK